jgi:mono/diheme cytochrome c family protein
MTRSCQETTNYEETINDSKCWPQPSACAGAGALLTSYARQETNPKMVAEKSRGAKFYAQNCASCDGAGAEGSDACCMMMSGSNLLSAVQRMNAKAFRDEVRRVGETNMCAGHPLDLSSADVEAIRNYLLELSKQAKPN